MYLNRLKSVYENMDKEGLSQIIVSDRNAIFYLFGKWTSVGERMLAVVLNPKKKPVMVINRLFFFEDPDCDVIYYDDSESGPLKLKSYIDPKESLGIDKFWPSRFLIGLMEANAAKSYKNTKALDLSRSIKDMDERNLMRESSHINDLCMEEFKKSLHYGVSELELMNKFYKIYEEHGCSRVSFTPIVAFKATAADPHHEPDEKTILEPGDMVLFDVGGCYKNYCSDMTRVFFTKEPTEFEKKIYNLVKKANMDAIAMIKPGVRLLDVDACARKVITDAGYGPYFNHRLGHFIGIEDHDFGDVSISSDIIAKPGMIFSIEPGIYIRDKIGVRIEDLVMVTDDGVEVLNEYSKDITVLDLK